MKLLMVLLITPRGYPGKYTSKFTEPLGRRFKSPHENEKTVILPVNTRFEYDGHRIQTDVYLNSNHIYQLLLKTDPMPITTGDINK